MSQITEKEMLDDIGAVIESVRSGKRILIGSRGVAMVPSADVDLLAQLEEVLEEEWAKDAVAKALKKGGRPIPADKVWKSLGL